MIAFLSSVHVERLGWTLLHFLWQGTVIAACYAVLRRICGPRLGAEAGYRVACLALLLIVAAPVATFIVLPVPGTLPSSGSWSVPVATADTTLRFVVSVWVVGVLFFSIRLFGGWRMLIRRLRDTSHPAPAKWQTRLPRISAKGSFGLECSSALISTGPGPHRPDAWRSSHRLVHRGMSRLDRA
jgi:hypothetical protein